MRRTPVIAALLMVVSACSGGASVPGLTTAATEATTSTTVPQPPACPSPLVTPDPVDGGPVIEQLAGSDVVGAALTVSQVTFVCATDVVVVSATDADRVALGARLAAALEGPLLLQEAPSSSRVDAEIQRLAPHRVVLLGDDVEVTVPEWTDVTVFSGDTDELARRVNLYSGVTRVLRLPAEPGPETVAQTIAAISEGVGLRPEPPADPGDTTQEGPTTDATSTTGETTTTVESAGAAAESAELSEAVVAGSGETGVAWLVEASETEIALVATAAATVSGGTMALVDGDELRRFPEVGRALQSSPDGVKAVYLIGDVTEDASWQLPVLLEGVELPGGGYLMFQGQRLVALYGNPTTPVLGVLGEQGPEAAVDRARSVATGYGADGLEVVLAFEMIATIADARAGADGNYSNEMSLDVLRPWVDVAREQGVYVVIDLQPGRTDFLTQAQLYEELLLEPHVGLAVDPEWRLGPGEFHLQQIGGVGSDEVNEVVDWLAQMVRDNHLPQKLLLLHQFQFSMLPGRELIETPPELAVVIQMDGQGTLEAKYETWGAITAGTEAAGWLWGWKNFYDEDSPMATPEEVLALEPLVVYVSFQ
jgi:hypothetical protein